MRLARELGCKGASRGGGPSSCLDDMVKTFFLPQYIRVVPLNRQDHVSAQGLATEMQAGTPVVCVFKIEPISLIDQLAIYHIQEVEIPPKLKKDVAILNIAGERYLLTHSLISKDFLNLHIREPERVRKNILLDEIFKNYRRELARIIRAYLNAILHSILSQLSFSVDDKPVDAKATIRWLEGTGELIYVIELRVGRIPNIKREKYKSLCHDIYDKITYRFCMELEKRGIRVDFINYQYFEEITGFSIEDIKYVFKANKNGKGPLALFTHGPYGVAQELGSPPIIVVKVLYSREEEEWKHFKEKLLRGVRNLSGDRCRISEDNRSIILMWPWATFRFEPIRIADVSSAARLIEEYKSKCVVVLLTGDKLGEELFGELKIKGIHKFPDGRSISRLQVFLKIEELDNKFVVGGFLSSILFRSRCIPWFVSVNEEVNKELERALVVAIAFAKLRSRYIRAIAIMMRGDGTILCTLSQDFQVSDSMEFRENEIEDFVNKLSKHIRELKFEFNKIIVIRPRIYKNEEIKKLTRKLDRQLANNLPLLKDGTSIDVILVSISNVHAPALRGENDKNEKSIVVKLSERSFLYYYSKWLHPLYVNFHSNSKIEIKSVLIMLEVLRRYHFMSVAPITKYPAPLTYANKMARWLRGAGAWPQTL